MDGDRFLQILSKNFARLKFPTTGRRFVSGWAAKCNSIAGDDAVFRAGTAGFPPVVLTEFHGRGGPILDTHLAERPVGKVIAYSILPEGLWVVAEMAQGSRAADACWREIIVGKKAGFSIRWQTDPAGEVLLGGLHLTRAARVVEISVVERPSEPEAGLLVGRYENPRATPNVESAAIRSRVAARAKLFLKEVLK